ncbi:MAG: NifU family protein [Gammaproteobacteria bacterium]
MNSSDRIAWERSEVESRLNEIRPAMEADGGGVELVSIENGVVAVRMKGTCLDCPSINLTLGVGIQRTLKKYFPWVEKVVCVD